VSPLGPKMRILRSIIDLRWSFRSPTNGFRYSGMDSGGRARAPGKTTVVVNAWVIENARSTFKLDGMCGPRWSGGADIRCCISQMVLRYDGFQVCWNKVINVIM
jgi:hypothetical protein